MMTPQWSRKECSRSTDDASNAVSSPALGSPDADDDGVDLYGDRRRSASGGGNGGRRGGSNRRGRNRRGRSEEEELDDDDDENADAVADVVAEALADDTAEALAVAGNRGVGGLVGEGEEEEEGFAGEIDDL